MKLGIIALLVIVGCLPGAAKSMDMNMSGHSSENLMWLTPMSWDAMRAQMAKMKEARAASGKPQSKRDGEQKRRTADNKDKKKKSGASSYMRRVYFIHSGAFPAPMKMRKSMPKKASAMSHDGMAMHNTMPAKPDAAQSRAPMGQMTRGMGNTVLWVKYPDNRVEMFEAQQRGPAWLTSFPSGDGGWYSLFAYNDMGVSKDGSRVHLFSHLTYFGHGEHADEKEPSTIEGPGYFQGRPVLELERVCADHNDCYRTTSGQNLKVRASFKGQPLADTLLTVTTEKGWRKTMRTDAHGMASFVLIKEEFPEEIDRRKSEDYLVSLNHTTDDMGMLDGQHYHGERYIATLPLRVYPSPLDWESRSVAFQVLAGTILVGGGAIAIRRKRRRPAA